MSESDRQRWNRAYAEGAPGAEPAPLLVAARPHLPAGGRALDVAGGAGRNALWLAGQGFAVTVVDISEQGLALAAQRAAAAGLTLDTVCADLEEQALPPGPWQVIVCFHYLQRSLFPAFAAALAPGGVLVFCQPTERNLERHPRPSARFLLKEGEAEALVRGAGLEPISVEEGWTDQGRHEARVISLRK